MSAEQEEKQGRKVKSPTETSETQLVGVPRGLRSRRVVPALSQGGETQLAGAPTRTRSRSVVPAPSQGGETQLAGAPTRTRSRSVVSAPSQGGETQLAGAPTRTRSRSVVPAPSQGGETQLAGAPTRSRSRSVVSAPSQGGETQLAGAPTRTRSRSVVPAPSQGGETQLAGAPTRSRSRSVVPAPSQGGETQLAGAPIRSRSRSVVSAPSQGGETQLAGAPTRSRSRSVVPAPSQGGETQLAGAPTRTRSRSVVPAPSQGGETQLAGAPARSRSRSVVPAPSQGGETQLAGSPTRTRSRSVVPAPSQGGETQLAGAPTRTRSRSVVSAPSQGGETQLAGAPTGSFSRRVVSAPASNGETQLAGAPTGSFSRRVVSAPSNNGETQLAGAPTRTRSRSVVSAPSQGGETQLAAPLSVSSASFSEVVPETSIAEESQENLAASPEVCDMDDTPLPNGTRIGKHGELVIDKVLGRGGFGYSYLVHNDSNITHVVKESVPRGCSYRDGLKVKPLPGPEYEDTFDRMQQMADHETEMLRAVKGLDSAIVYLNDAFSMNLTRYVVMNLLPGGSWPDWYQARCAEKNPFTEPELVEMLKSMLGALKAIHSKDILHRDIKPENIMLTETKDSVLIDFGAACYRQQLADFDSIASLLYSAPEQLASDFVQHMGYHSDLYALGACIFYMITGEGFNDKANAAATTVVHQTLGGDMGLLNALDYQSILKVMEPHLSANLKRIMGMTEFSIGFRKALCKALQPDVGKRFAKAEEWLELISEENLAVSRVKEQFARLSAEFRANAEKIKDKQLKEMKDLAAKMPEAHISLAHFYLERSRRCTKSQDKQANEQRYEAHLKSALDRGVPEAAIETAENMLRRHLGGMEVPVLEKAAKLYRKAEKIQEAENCEQAAAVMRRYKALALKSGLFGGHNLYLNKAEHQGMCCVKMHGSEKTRGVNPKLRGLMQLFCSLGSGLLAAPFVWLMAQREAESIARTVAPAHLTLEMKGL